MTAGSGYGAVLVLLAFPEAVEVLPLGTLAFGLLAITLVLAFAWGGRGGGSTQRLILAGIAVSALFGTGPAAKRMADQGVTFGGGGAAAYGSRVVLGVTAGRVATTRIAIAHLNADHADALLLMAQAFGGYPDAIGATCTAADRYGLDLGVHTPRGPATTRIWFTDPIAEADGLRSATVDLTRRARQALA